MVSHGLVFVVGIVARYTSVEYSIVLPGACGVLGGLIIIPIIISKARKAHESEKMTLKAIVIGMHESHVSRFKKVYFQM